MRTGVKAVPACFLEQTGKRLRREGLLGAAEADADHAEILHFPHLRQRARRRGQLRVTHQIGHQCHLDLRYAIEPPADRSGRRLRLQALVSKV